MNAFIISTLYMYKGSRLQYIDGEDTVSMEVWHSHMLMVTTKLRIINVRHPGTTGHASCANCI